MSQHPRPPLRWELVDRLKENFQSSFELPAPVMSAIADKLEQAICAPSEITLNALSADLLSLVREVVRRAPKDAVDAALNAGSSSVSAKAAHLLGQLGFAQLLAAQVASRRAGDEFFNTINSGRFRPYAELLLEGEMRNMDIANQLDVEEETVSRVMKILRTEGITDFRKKGREVFNFLTPSATAVMSEIVRRTPEARTIEKSENGRVDLRQLSAVKVATRQTPEHLLTRQTLSITEYAEEL